MMMNDLLKELRKFDAELPEDPFILNGPMGSGWYELQLVKVMENGDIHVDTKHFDDKAEAVQAFKSTQVIGEIAAVQLDRVEESGEWEMLNYKEM